jgi:ketosteroid isomerase-like protein
MDDTQTLMTERACTRLIVDYCHFVDNGEAARVADQFTGDGVWLSGEENLKGQAAIRRRFEQRQAMVERMSRHVCTNIKLDVIDADHAEGVTYLILFRHDGEPRRRFSPTAAPEMIGEYRDRFARTAEGWRFQRRELVVSFLRPAEPRAGSKSSK